MFIFWLNHSLFFLLIFMYGFSFRTADLRGTWRRPRRCRRTTWCARLRRCWTWTTATTSRRKSSCSCACMATPTPSPWSSGRWRCANCRGSSSMASASRGSPAPTWASRISLPKSPTNWSSDRFPVQSTRRKKVPPPKSPREKNVKEAEKCLLPVSKKKRSAFPWGDWLIDWFVGKTVIQSRLIGWLVDWLDWRQVNFFMLWSFIFFDFILLPFNFIIALLSFFRLFSPS